MIQWQLIFLCILYLFAFVALATAAVIFSVHFLSIVYCRFLLCRKPRTAAWPLPAGLRAWPGVSILKPVIGDNSTARENAESYFTMQYPTYELLYCFETADDPAIAVIESLRRKYPHVDCQILTGLERTIVNPKISNMYKGYKVAKYDVILISDESIFVRSDTVMDMVHRMFSEARVGMVHQIPWVMDQNSYYDSFVNNSRLCVKTLKDVLRYRRLQPSEEWNNVSSPSLKSSAIWDTPTLSFGRLLQYIYFGTYHARMYLGANFLGLNCATGMSTMVRKEMVDSAPGGFLGFGRYLAEDFFLGKYLIDNRWKMRLSRQPAWQNHPSVNYKGFRNRTTRWYQLRIKMLPHTILFEPLSEMPLNTLCAALSLYLFFPTYINPFIFYALYVTAWCLLDYCLLVHMFRAYPDPAHQRVPFSKLAFLCLWIYREFGSLAFQFKGARKKTVTWRGKRFRVYWGGLTDAVSAKEKKKPDNKSKASEHYVNGKTGHSNGTIDVNHVNHQHNNGNLGKVSHVNNGHVINGNLVGHLINNGDSR